MFELIQFTKLFGKKDLVKGLIKQHTTNQSACVEGFTELLKDLIKGRNRRQRQPTSEQPQQAQCTPQKKPRSGAFRADLPATPANKRPRRLNAGEYSICGVSKNGSPLKQLPPDTANIMVNAWEGNWREGVSFVPTETNIPIILTDNLTEI